MDNFLVSNKRPRYLLIVSFGSLLFGFSIYLLCRSNQIRSISFLERNSKFVLNLREYSIKNIEIFPPYFVYNLPDGLFLFSYTTMMLFLWYNSRNKYTWILILPSFLILVEFLQLAKIVKGTFDFYDIFFYLLFVSITFFLGRQKHTN